MENQTKTQATDSTEALLEGLIAECHGIIRDGILPAVQSGAYHSGHGKSWHDHIGDIANMMDRAVKLADAVGRLRRPEPPPELRQRITVERIEPVPRLPPPEGEGGG